MLWLKSWLETRFRMLFVVGFLVLVLGSAYSRVGHSQSAGAGLVRAIGVFWLVPAVMLAGEGIKTQPAFQATKGMHGSVFFTLSLPVSRLRLLAVRATVGLIETSGSIAAGCFALWAMFPAIRESSTPLNFIQYAAAILVCASAFYFLSVFLATFLDDIWRIFSSAAAIVLAGLLSARLPSPFNVFQAMGEASPLITHTLPWAAMGVSVVFAVIFFLAALKIARVREY